MPNTGLFLFRDNLQNTHSISARFEVLSSELKAIMVDLDDQINYVNKRKREWSSIF